MRNVLCKTQTLSTQQAEAIGQEFEKQQALIDKLIWKHISSRGGDYDTLFSRAIDTLIVAYLRHDPSRSEWQKYIYHQLTLGIMNVGLEEKRLKHPTKTNLDDHLHRLLSFRKKHSEDTLLDDLRNDLTDDARTFLDYYFQETSVVLRRDTHNGFRATMRARGWSQTRTKMAMLEVRDILIAMIREAEK
jgi:thioesterase domain-containing protein